jgi:hypothetical protein
MLHVTKLFYISQLFLVLRLFLPRHAGQHASARHSKACCLVSIWLMAETSNSGRNIQLKSVAKKSQMWTMEDMIWIKPLNLASLQSQLPRRKCGRASTLRRGGAWRCQPGCGSKVCIDEKKHGIAPAAERGYQNVYNCVYICVCVCVFISDYIEDLSNFHLYLKFKCVLSICRGRV